MRIFFKALSALVLVLGISATAKADVITEWNQTAIRMLGQAKLPSGAPTRALAMMHAAMFEAVNSIDPRFAPYGSPQQVARDASPVAAASAAAYRVLAGVIPAQAAALDARHQALTATIPDGPQKAAGIAVGEKVATMILTLRANDGADFSTDYQPPQGAGMYVRTSGAP